MIKIIENNDHTYDVLKDDSKIGYISILGSDRFQINLKYDHSWEIVDTSFGSIDECSQYLEAQ